MRNNELGPLKDAADIQFKFGENWRKYSNLIGEDQINEAKSALRRLLGIESLERKSFLDIGCGSGLHALAALRLGAEKVVGLDIDWQSVETSKKLIPQFWGGSNWTVERSNMFELSKENLGQFDIVYSWGVLHHTGDMWGAVAKSTEFVKDGGLFAIAIYRKTPLCNVWRWIKKRYSASSRSTQRAVFATYVAIFVIALVVSFRNPTKYIRSYSGNRGMNFFIDVHDWLGGFPYESACPDHVIAFVESRGFSLRQKYCRTTKLLGLFGTGCDEFLFKKT